MRDRGVRGGVRVSWVVKNGNDADVGEARTGEVVGRGRGARGRCAEEGRREVRCVWGSGGVLGRRGRKKKFERVICLSVP